MPHPVLLVPLHLRCINLMKQFQHLLLEITQWIQLLNIKQVLKTQTEIQSLDVNLHSHHLKALSLVLLMKMQVHLQPQLLVKLLFLLQKMAMPLQIKWLQSLLREKSLVFQSQPHQARLTMSKDKI